MAEQVLDLNLKKEVDTKLVLICKDNSIETLLRILFYLDEECKDNVGTPPVWSTLYATLDSEQLFQLYVECLVEGTRIPEIDQQFRKTLGLVYSELVDDPYFDVVSLTGLTPSNNNSLTEDYSFVQMTDIDLRDVQNFIGLSRACSWGLIPLSTQSEILQLIPAIIANSSTELARIGANFPMPSLVGILLPTRVQNNLDRWWSGDIPGKRAAKNIIDFTFTFGAEMTGIVKGATIGGSAAGPIGAVAGGIFFGVLSAVAMNILIETLTTTIFGIPRTEALENAYSYLGVPATATNGEINSAYRKLCLTHHPDKGGSPQEFVLLQVHMGVIKAARGELINVIPQESDGTSSRQSGGGT